MEAYIWVSAALFALGVVTAVSSVGKPRQPIEPSTAAIIVLLYGGFIFWGLSLVI